MDRYHKIILNKNVDFFVYYAMTAFVVIWDVEDDEKVVVVFVDFGALVF